MIIMKKIILAILILGIICNVAACKKNTSESADAATIVPMETVDNIYIELEEGQTGEVAPD